MDKLMRIDPFLREIGVLGRIMAILAIVLALHLLVLVVRALGRRAMGAGFSPALSKVRTVIGLAVSTTVFTMYFLALGLALKEVGVSLKAYLASASIIGLAVGFGSQGLVQDVVTGLTVLFSNLFNVGDMVEIGGQTGTVQAFGLRFTVLRNYLGADVSIPNRTITSVVRYPKGYVKAHVDLILPEAGAEAEELAGQLLLLSQHTFGQFPGLLVREPSGEGRLRDSGGGEILRVTFRIWPGQQPAFEGLIRSWMAPRLREADPRMADWRLVVSYAAEAGRTVLRKQPQ